MTASARKIQRLTFQEREERILDAAVKLFSENGFRGTTTKDIAIAADVNEALIFRHYDSKESLYTAALRHVLSHKSERVLPGLDSLVGLPLEPALIKLLETFVGENRRHPEFIRMLLFCGLESHKLARRFLSRGLPLFEWVEKFFARKIAVGEIIRGDPGLLARTFMSLACQYVLNVEIVGAKDFYKSSEKAVLRFFVRTFVNGVVV